MTKSTVSLVLFISLIATGCELQSDEDSIRQALPTADTVKINLPDQAEEQVALGAIAETYLWTRATTRMFNGGAAIVLVIVHAVVQHPPTAVDGNTYTWGPFSDALDPADYRLTVTDNLDGTYDWELAGRSKTEENAQFIAVVTGKAIEGADPHRGSGNFTIDFDAGAELDPTQDPELLGSVEVTYDLENRDGTRATVEMHIDSRDEAGEPVVADYSYGELEDGSGDFVFSCTTDIDENGSLAEDARIRSRWQADGAGRADVSATGGDLGADVAVVNQCWNTRFRSVYEDFSAVTGEGSIGDEADCAFTAAELP